MKRIAYIKTCGSLGTMSIEINIEWIEKLLKMMKIMLIIQ